MSKCNSKDHFDSRRSFLKLLGASSCLGMMDPLQLLMNGFAGGIIKNARAQALNVEPRTLVSFIGPGGIDMLNWNLVLNPKDPKNFNPLNPGVVTNFNEQGLPVYQTFSYQGYELPWLWGTHIPSFENDMVIWKPMTDLLPYTTIIKGLNMMGNNHEVCRTQLLRPSAVDYSINGILADASSRALASVSFGEPDPKESFYSKKSSQSFTNLYQDLNNNIHPLDQVLQPYLAGPKVHEVLNRQESLEALVQGSLKIIQQYVESKNPGARVLESDRYRSEKIIRDGIQNFKDVYEEKKQRYQKLLNEVAKIKIVKNHGIPQDLSSSKISLSNCIPKELQLNGGEKITQKYLEDVVSTMNAFGLAETFACVEYLVENKLSSSVVAPIGNILGLNLGPKNPNINFNMDEHNSNVRYVGLAVRNFHFQSLSTCLLELVQKLKGYGLLDETVLSISTEFQRKPRALYSDGKIQTNCEGSDHAGNANSLTIISGANPNFRVLGSIAIQTPTMTENYPGFWGKGGNVELGGRNQPLSISQGISALAAYLRVSKPQINAFSPVNESNLSSEIIEGEKVES